MEKAWRIFNVIVVCYITFAHHSVYIFYIRIQIRTKQRQVVKEMLKLRELFGTAIVIVTHDIGVVRAMADTVLVLKKGKTVEYGTADRVLDHPRDPYTRKLLEAVPKLQRKVRV